MFVGHIIDKQQKHVSFLSVVIFMLTVSIIFFTGNIWKQ